MHFSSNSYNFFKFNGKTKATQASYNSRKDKYHFDKLAHKFSREKIIEKMLVEQIHNSNFWVKDLLEKDNETRYLKFRGYVEGIRYYLKKEFSLIREYCLKSEIEIVDVFKIKEGTHPIIFKFLLRNDIRIETFIALDIVMLFSNNMNKKKDFDPIWKDQYLLMTKYYPFISHYLPESKEIKSMFKEIFLT
jgi:hypothetical protein